MVFLRILLLTIATGFAPIPASAGPAPQIAQHSAACPSGCSGNGECVGTQCQCYPGWTGPGCAQSRGAVPRGHGCLNGCTEHGICRNDRCLCYPGWTGQDCGRKVQGALPCTNGCYANRGWGFCANGQCVCEEGRGGADCGIDLDPVDEADSVLDDTCPGGCGTFGVCLEGECLCRKGGTGRNCRSPVLPAAPARAR